jgi:hypothetical protein
VEEACPQELGAVIDFPSEEQQSLQATKRRVVEDR